MLKVNKKTEYALIALKHLQAQEAGYLMSAKEVTEKYQTPFDATSRVLQKLASAKWLVSEQGAHGGYKLNRELQGLNFLELMEIVEGPQAIVKCLGPDGTIKKCDLIDTCNMITPLGTLNSMLLSFLKDVSVGDLIQQTTEGNMPSDKIFSQTADIN